MEKDPIQLALEHAALINEAIENSDASAKPKGLRSRIRQLPGYILDAGLSATLLFYASKLEEDEYSWILSVLVRSRKAEKLPKKIVEGLEREGGGYGATLALVLTALRDLGIIKAVPAETPEILSTIRTLRQPGIESRAEAALRSYLEALKRAADALWGEVD